MPDLPHSPLPYYVAAVTLYVLIIAAVLLIRIWRKRKPKYQEGRLRRSITSEDVERATTISVEFDISMGKIKTQIGTTAAQLAHFASVWRRQMAQIGWLAHDPPYWDFPTWRVTRRPFDWRID